MVLLTALQPVGFKRQSNVKVVKAGQILRTSVHQEGSGDLRQIKV